jgi:hypothetical protein
MNSAASVAPIPRQALDEGRVRVAGERGLQVAVQGAQPAARARCVGGELAHEVGGDALAGDGDRLLVRGRQGLVGELVGVPARDASGPEDVLDQPAASRSADLAGRDVAAQQLLAGLGRGVHDALEARMDRGEQVAQPVDAARLVADQLAATTDEQPDLGVQLAGGLDRAQVAPVTHPVGDDRGVARVALVLAARRALARATDRQPRDVHDLDPGFEQHRGQHARDAADDVDADLQRPAIAQTLQSLDERGQRRRRVVHTPAEDRLAVAAIHGLNPVKVLGHVDADRDPFVHVSSSMTRDRPGALTPDVALPSDRSQCLISGDGERTRRGEQPPEPSTAASMKSILASPTTKGRAA